MSMFVWPDGTVTGSVNVAELEQIQKDMKGVGKRKLAALTWPIETAAQLSDQLAGVTVDDDEPEPPKAATASESKSKADTKSEADKAEAMSRVDLPAALGKSTTKKGTS